MSIVPRWTITVPVEKSEHDGGRYLIGIAAGPGIDAQNDRITPEAIQRFSDQISTNPIPLRNFHIADDITADLGEVTKAWITGDGTLGVEILLDDDNKDSDFIWKKVGKGKQYGLSIHGDAKDYWYENDPASAKRVRVLNDVPLDHIGITTRPAFTPSFGTVVRKSIEDAEGENTLSKEQETPEVVETEVVTTEVVKTEVETVTPTVPETIEETPEVEKAITASTPKETRKLTSFGKDLQKVMDQAASLGLLTEPADETTASVSETEPSVVEHSTAIESSSTEVEKSLRDEITALSAKFDQILDMIPGTNVPPVQVSKSTTDALAEEIAKMSISERIKFGAAVAHLKGN